jgi:ferredoxin
MCQYCSQYSEVSDYWYLDPRNHTVATYEKSGVEGLVEKVSDMAWSHSVYERSVAMKEKAPVITQTVPLEDALKVIDLAEDAALEGQPWFEIHDCPCVIATTGDRVFKCMRFGVSAELRAQQTGGRLVSAQEFRDKLIEFDDLGLVHNLNAWGLGDRRYVMHICNCELPTCMPLRSRLDWGSPPYGKAEYVAMVNMETCNGCERCASRCHFGAIQISRMQKEASIDPRKCFGCGLCRVPCRPKAITLIPRISVPIARDQW